MREGVEETRAEEVDGPVAQAQPVDLRLLEVDVRRGEERREMLLHELGRRGRRLLGGGHGGEGALVLALALGTERERERGVGGRVWAVRGREERGGCERGSEGS